MRLAVPLACLILLAAGQAHAECVVPPFRGATSAAGATATMTMTKDSTCSFQLFVDVPNTVPFSTTNVTNPPKAGAVSTDRQYVRYRPRPGYTGPDTFTLALAGTTQKGQPLLGSVTVQVTVNP